MQKTYADENDEIEIDLRELFYEFKKKFWILVLAFVVGAGAVGSWTHFLITPQYKSEAKLYVLSKETTLTSLADLQIGTQLTQDYKVLISSRPVMEGVISNLKLDLTYKGLAAKLKVDNPKDTRILSLTVEDADPHMAKAIVDDIAQTASEYIGEIMEMIPPKLIEDGVVAALPSSPNLKKNALIGGLAIFMLACGLITLRVITNDTIRTEEDVERYLDLPVLAVLPRKKEADGKKKEASSGKSTGKKAVRKSLISSEPVSRRKKTQKPLPKEDMKEEKKEDPANE